MPKPIIVKTKHSRQPHRQTHVVRSPRRTNPIKVSVSMIVCNEEEYIGYALKSIYDFAYEIIIVEGAVRLYMHAAKSDGSSVDRTMDIIKNFPDPDGKIMILKGKWENKAEMKLAAWKRMTGDYYMIVDADEMYKKEDLKKLQESVLNAPKGTIWFAFSHIHFWQDFRTITIGNQWDTIHPRFCRKLNHFTYRIDHKYGHTTLFDKKINQFVIPFKQYPTVKVDILCYHYGYVRCMNNVIAKEKFYEKRRGEEDFTWQYWRSGEPTKFNGKAVEFKKEHPEIMRGHPYYKMDAEAIKAGKKLELGHLMVTRPRPPVDKAMRGKTIIDSEGKILKRATEEQVRRIREKQNKPVAPVNLIKPQHRYKATQRGYAKPKYERTGQIIAPKSQKLGRIFNLSMPKKDTAVTLVVVHYGNVDLTKRCINSLINETNYKKLSIVLVDNDVASSDNYFDRYLNKKIPFKIITNQNNVGFPVACNQGVEASETALVCIMNNDLTVANRDWLKEMVDALYSMDNIGMVGCKLIYPPDHPKKIENKSIANTIQHAGIVFRDQDKISGKHLCRYEPRDSPDANQTIEVPAVTGACILYQKELYLALGGYDKAFGYGYCEDIDMSFKMRDNGYKIMYCHKAELFHYESPSLKVLGLKIYKEQRAKNQELLDKRWNKSSLVNTSIIKRLRIGIITAWRPQGIGYIAKDFRRVLKDKYDIFILSRKSDVNSLEWRIRNIEYLQGNNPKYTLEWAQRNGLDLVISAEVNNWSGIRAMTVDGIRNIAFMVSDTTRKYCREMSHEYLQAILTPTKYGAEVHRKFNFNDNVYAYNHPIDLLEFKDLDKQRQPKEPGSEILFFHNAGHGGWDKRKNTLVAAEAFHLLDVEAQRKSKLLIHLQGVLSNYGRRLQYLVSRNKGIEVHEGTVSREEIIEMTAAADVSILPSKWEGLGIPFLESLACGVPVITVDCPPMNSIITNGVTGYAVFCNIIERSRMTGWIVPEAKVSSKHISIAMRKFITEPSLVARMGNNGKSYIRKYYGEEKTSQKLHEIIEKELNR